MRRWLGPCAGGLLVTALAGSLVLDAAAEGLDPSAPLTMVVGAPKGVAPAERVDRERTGRSKVKLPSEATEAWKKRLGGGIETAPIVDEKGASTFLLTSRELVRLSIEGKEQWRARLESAQASTLSASVPPIVLSNGTIVAMSSEGRVFGIAQDGTSRFSSTPGIRGRDADVTPLALDDGGFVIAAGRTVIELGSDGSVRARAQLDERAVGALLPGPEGTLITMETGAVYSFKPPGLPRKVGSFGGAVRKGAVRADKRTLLAVVDGKRIVSLDIPTGSAHTRASASVLLGGFDAPVAVMKNGTVVTGTWAGLLLSYDSGGTEKLRVPLDQDVAVPDPSAVASAAPVPSFSPFGGGGGFGGSFGSFSVDQRPSPGVLVDPDNRIAFVRANGRAGLVSADGTSVTLLSERVCGTPIALQPAGAKKLLVTCRDGTVTLFKD